ncbi:MAG: hypothetical protein COV34_00475 [Candidatus Zambryskibacteria bacterium CG10_big_fil_rev_8_21_14_0_10_42_12]|uniref:2'-deoxycytidine 5'-triphosphate deaminase n=1 Tax=Candidatus Zambryskibacteria bacterium CG10_big_fil_rev_8_21_14_0_10_42_12 TaxID=1975115 RepID=A0A2H0QWZ3_9BACT|nr:MAG: hypothetical protein COV34_00475 [Candidatus Zambryskibacteria bacterium CG10_big_fil_rev_8_21_14_0_10_42_12]
MNKQGALPDSYIQRLIASGHIKGATFDHVRPGSLDLRLSEEVYKVESIFQPRRGEKVRDVLSRIKAERHDPAKPIARDAIYLWRLNEILALPQSVYAYCNPKSSTGRLDLHVRLIADGVPRYDSVWPKGFHGELWVSLMTKSFPTIVSPGDSLNQIRFFNADTRMSDLELEMEHHKSPLIYHPDTQKPIGFDELEGQDGDGTILLSIDLESSVAGYESITSSHVVELARRDHDKDIFFKQVYAEKGALRLERDKFYILSSYESVVTPPDLACEMVPMDERSGEFRSHYAGFIDPGWGWGKEGEGKGRQLTLEVRPFEDIVVRHKQPIAKIRFERLIEPPEVLYDLTDSNYIAQRGPKLGKFFV